MTAIRRIPSHAVDRPMLRAQIDVGVQAPLTLIVAPAGAGKTVLLSQWAEERPDIEIAWFDITASDRSAIGFSRRVVEGIAEVASDFRTPTTPASEGRLGEAFLEDLAANLASAGTIVLIFDDLHHLSGSPILPDLWRLVDLLPPNAHAVFASRVDLQLGWSRHRLQHGLVEIRQRELAFDECTTANVLEKITGRTMTSDTVAMVTARTEGWAVGVQLSALTLRFALDPERIVDQLTDTDRLVVDYLSEEVLDSLAPERRAALMHIAVLDEVCAALIEELTDLDGAVFLSQLEHDSLFLVRVPGRAGWYRFHRLFRDLLLYRLRASQPADESNVLCTAADWYIRRDDVDTAIEYLIRARQWDRVLDTVLTTPRDIYEDGLTGQIASWLAQVPPEFRARRPDAELLFAIASGMSGHSARGVADLQRLLATDRLTTGRRQVALAYLAAGVQFQPNPELFLDTARTALSLLAKHPAAALPDLLGVTSHPLLVITSQVSLARAHMFLGRLAEAREALVDALESGLLTYAPYRVHALGSLALVDALSGRLTSAAELADDALEAARDFGLLAHPAPADAYLARAIAAIQRGEPEVGAVALSEGALRAASNRRTPLMWLAHLISQFVDPSDANAAPEPPGTPPPFVRQSLAALELRRSRLRGAPSAPPPQTPSWSPLAFEEIAALLTAGQASTARTRLTHFAPEARTLTHASHVEFELLAAWLCAVEGRPVRAREHIGAALVLAEPERLVHPFIRVGPVILDLLAEAPGGRSDFTRFVESRLGTDAPPRADRLMDELTPRELELLTYLPSRFTIADIASRCFVSTNTIKTHLGHIYRKLGVTGRDAAIERATELGLLDPSVTSRMA